MTEPNPLDFYFGYGGPGLGGVRIVTSTLLPKTVRTLHARSPSRAKRRAKRGYPQHYIEKPYGDVLRLPDGSLVMRPETLAALRARLA